MRHSSESFLFLDFALEECDTSVAVEITAAAVVAAALIIPDIVPLGALTIVLIPVVVTTTVSMITMIGFVIAVVLLFDL